MSTERSDGTSGVEGRDPKTVESVAAVMVEVRDTSGPAATRDEVEEMIRSRLERDGLEISDGEIADLAAQLVEGDEPIET